MEKKTLIIRELNMHKVPGFPSGLAIRELSKNINLIVGPNGSGKSTTARAIREVLWPSKDIKNQEIQCLLELEDAKWMISLDHGVSKTQRNGVPDNLPNLPVTEESKRYSLALHELIKDDDNDLAVKVAQEMLGGFDLLQAGKNLGFDEKFNKTSIKEYKDFIESKDRTKELDIEHLKLKGEEDDLKKLGAEKEKAEKAIISKDLYKDVVAYLEAELESSKLREQLELLPNQLTKMTGNEEEELEKLEVEINENRRDAKEEEEILESKKKELKLLGLPEEGIKKELLDELDLRVFEVIKTADDLKRNEIEIDKLKVDLDNSLKRIPKGERDILPSNIDILEKFLKNIQQSDIEVLKRMLHKTHLNRSKKQVLESKLNEARKLAQPGLYDEAELNEGIRLLTLWLKEPIGTEQNKTIWLWILVAAGLITALSVYFLVWLGLIGGIVMVVLGILASRNRISNQADNRIEDYERTKLNKPKKWDQEEVLLELNDLYSKLLSFKKAEMAQYDIKSYHADLEDVKLSESKNHEERDRWLKDLAFFPELPKEDLETYDGLYLFVLALVEYQLAYKKLLIAQSESKTLNDQRDKQFLHINRLLNGLFEKVTSEPAAKAAYNKLTDYEGRREVLTNEIKEINRRLNSYQDKENKATQKLSDLYIKMQILQGNKDELINLVKGLENYRKVKKEYDQKEYELNNTLGKLKRYNLYEEIRKQIDENKLTLESAKSLEQKFNEDADNLGKLNEEIIRIKTIVSGHKKNHVLEDALLSKEIAFGKLEESYRENLASITGSLILNKLKESTNASENSGVCKEASRIFNKITNGRYKLLVDDTNSAAFKAFDTTTNQGQDLSILSTGTRIQLLLSVRLAFIESQEKSIKLPIIADEILANSDDQRAQEIIKALVEISKDGRQVFYFTSQNDEIAKWNAYQKIDPELEVVIRTLPEASQNYFDYTQNVQSALPIKLVNSYPKLGTMTRLEYGNALKFPVFSLLTNKVGELHLWYIIEDLQFLYRCLEKNIPIYGQLLSYHENGGTINGLSTEMWQNLKEKVELLDFYQELYIQGRPKPIDREVLVNSSAVSEIFINDVGAKLKELNHNPEKLVLALKNAEVAGYRKGKAEDLEQYLLFEGYLDNRQQISDEEILIRLQAFFSKNNQNQNEAFSFLEQFILELPH